MKNTIYIAIIIALLAIVAFIFLSPSDVVAPEVVEEEVSEEQEGEDVVSVEYQYQVDLERSEITWTAGKKFIAEYVDKGTIEILSGGLNLVALGGPSLSGQFLFDMNSIVVTETGFGGGFPGLERDLKSDNFFSVDDHPTAKFVITNYSDDGTNQIVDGDLTIRGITKPISFVLSEWNEMDQYIAASVTVNRLDYGIDFRSEGLIGRVENQVINDTFDIDFKIYYK